MRLHAYVLAADPAWLVQSVRSYYDLVDRIVVSYDQDATSWTGTPLEVEHCLRLLKTADPDGKIVHSPGHYARPEHKPMDNETYQRQRALDEASEGADWVLQLDTDEVFGAPATFLDCLA